MICDKVFKGSNGPSQFNNTNKGDDLKPTIEVFIIKTRALEQLKPTRAAKRTIQFEKYNGPSISLQHQNNGMLGWNPFTTTNANHPDLSSDAARYLVLV